MTNLCFPLFGDFRSSLKFEAVIRDDFHADDR